MGGMRCTIISLTGLLLVAAFAPATEGFQIKFPPVLRKQRTLLQSGGTAPGYFLSPAIFASPSVSSPNPKATPNPNPAANSTSKSKSTGGISSTARTGIIIGVIVCLGLALIVAAGLYVWCRHNNQLKAPGYKSSGLQGGGHAGHRGSFDILLTDTNSPPDSGGLGGVHAVAPVVKPPGSTGTRGGPVVLPPPASWRDDASSDVSRGSVAPSSRSLAPSGRTRSQPDVLDASPAVIRGYPVRSFVSHASSASMSSAISADPSLGTATSFASTATATTTATAAPHRRSSSTGSESLPSASIAVPRLPAVPLSTAGGGGAAGLIPGTRGHVPGAGATRGNTASGAAGPDPFLAVVGYGVMAACVSLAREIVEAADRVVANHARCRRIITRVQLLEPLLRKLQTRLDGQSPPQDIDPMLQHLREVYTDCRGTILKWCDNSGSWKQVVLNLVRSRAFQDEFLDLHDRLSTCYNDLSLALNINQTTAPPASRTIDKREAEADLQEDLRELAGELMSRGWGELEPEEQALVKELYAQHGLDLDQLLKQAKKVWQEDKIKDLRVPWRHIHVKEEVGSGGYGTVYRAEWAGSEVAVKKFSATAVTDRVRKELEREAYIMSTLHHPNVARFFGVVIEHPHYALLMQYYADGTLLQLLHKDAPLPWQRRYRLAHDIAQGMCYLHSRPVEAIVHGDLKSSNLLLTSEGRVVITDFGLAKVKTTTKTIAPGAGGVSACYCAPELLNAVSVRRTPACDVYSYGMIMFEIATREMPFEGLDIHLIYNHVRQGVRPDIPNEVPQAFSELIRWCWAQKPTDRPTFDQITERLSTFLT